MNKGMIFSGVALAGFVAVKFMAADVAKQINAPRHTLDAKIVSVDTMCFIQNVDSANPSEPFECDNEANFRKKNAHYSDGQTLSGDAVSYQFSVPDNAEVYSKRVILNPKQTTRKFKVGQTIPVSVRLDKPQISKLDYSKI